jgi:protein involved in ribonucleotide reduction
MNKLVESDIELAAIEWLEELEYTYIHGSDIQRPLKKVVLEDRLHDFISKKYNYLNCIIATGNYIRNYQKEFITSGKINQEMSILNIFTQLIMKTLKKMNSFVLTSFL